MRKAILFNTCAEVDFFFQHLEKEVGEILFISLNPSIDVYLKTNFSRKSLDLCSCVSSSFVAETIKKSERLAKQVVGFLDEKFSPHANEILNLGNIRFFQSLFSYSSYIQFIGCINLFAAFERVRGEFSLAEILYFDQRAFEMFPPGISLTEIFRSFEGPLDMHFEVLPALPKEKKARARDLNLLKEGGGIFKKIFTSGPNRLIRGFLKRLAERKYLSLRPRPCSPSILVFEELYDLKFILPLCRNTDFIYFSNSSALWPKGCSPKKFSLPERPEFTIDDSLLTTFDGKEGWGFLFPFVARFLVRQFSNFWSELLPPLHFLDQIHKERNIRLGIWGNSPVSGFKALAFEYLIANKVPVVGCQHGGLLGNRYNDDVYLSDLSKCSHYISYGFTKADFQKLYPDQPTECEILPLGCANLPRFSDPPKSPRPAFDFLFVPMNSASILEGGMIRQKPDLLAKKQQRIVEFLAAQKGVACGVKPFAGSNSDNLAIFENLKNSSTLQVILGKTFREVLQEYEIRCLLFEHLSTSIYEALAFDIEIIVWYDGSVRPVEEVALDELKKRVHYTEREQEFFEIVDQFKSGSLEKKRDRTFFEHHVFKKNTRGNVLSVIRKILPVLQGNSLRLNHD